MWVSVVVWMYVMEWGRMVFNEGCGDLFERQPRACQGQRLGLARRDNYLNTSFINFPNKLSWV